MTIIPRRALAALLALFLATAAWAEPVALAVRAEIEALLDKLAASGCAFNRNGSWYDAAEARAHLLEKLAYLERRRLVRTTEQFIERAASGSSASGKPYLVKCGDAAPVESGTWLSAELRSLRGARSDGEPTRRPEHARAMTTTGRPDSAWSSGEARTMAIDLDHAIVPARDRRAAAE